MDDDGTCNSGTCGVSMMSVVCKHTKDTGKGCEGVLKSCVCVYAQSLYLSFAIARPFDF
jgi:hypothetical protein